MGGNDAGLLRMSANGRLGSVSSEKLRGLVEAARVHGPSLALLTALTVVMCRNLIFSAEFPGGWDVASVSYPIAYFARIGSYFSLWEDSGTGYVTPITLFHLLAFVAHVLGDPALVARAVLVFAVLLAALLMYLYVFISTGRVLASLTAGIIFATSPHLVAHAACGHGFLVLAYALTPLLFLLLDRGLAQVTAARVLGLGLALSLLPALRMDPIAYVLPFVFLFALWHVIMAGRQWRAAATNALLLLTPAVTLAGLLSAYVWLPLLRTGTVHATMSFGLPLIAGNSLSLWPSLMGQSLIYSYLFWRGDTAYYTHQFLPPIVYAAVLMVAPGLAFAQARLREDRRVSFLLIAALVSVFLAKGPLPPLGEVYGFLWQYVPFINQLHVPNRWLMITWFAYAFLAGLTVDRTYRAIRQWLATLARPPLTQAASVAAVVALLLGCTVGVSYVFTDGYQTWQVPQEELAPHRWLGEYAGEGRFLDVPFEGERGFVSGGWLQHDLGVTGGMFGGRPSFDRPYVGGYVDDFFSCLEALADMKVQSLAKIIGAYDVRYVVTQGYSGNALTRQDLAYSDTAPSAVVQEYSEHEYFDGLAGLTKVFEGPEAKYTLLVGVSDERDLTQQARRSTLWPLEPERTAAVYENEYWLPRAFVAKNRMLVVGGPESLATLADWEGFSFQDWDIRFAGRTLNELGRQGLIEEVQGTDLLLLNNSELLDLTMMMTDSERVDLGAAARDPLTQWHLADSSSDFVEERSVLWTTVNHAQVRLPVDLDQVPTVDDSELWARVYYGTGTPVLHFEVDGKQAGSVLPRAGQEMGFVWQKVGTARLGSGPHEILVTALGTGGAFTARLDEVAIVGVGAIDEAMGLLAGIVGESDIPVVSLQDQRRVWTPSGASTDLSRFSQFDIALDNPKEAGVRRVLYGGQPEIPDFLSRGRFVVREADAEGGYTPLLQLEFEEPKDWREATYLSLDFKGVGRGDKVRLRIAFAGLGTAFYSFEDLSSQWEAISIPLFDPERTEGTMRWDQVSMLIVDTSGVDMAGGVGLGTIRMVQDSLSLDHLSSELGMRTLMRTPWNPTPAFAATLLSAPGDQPAEILSWVRVSPWEYRFRVVAAAPYDLVVSNTYDPLWRVILDGRELAPQPAYYIASAYAIDKVGEYDLILEFVGQRYQWFAFSLSGLTYAGSCFALVGFIALRRRKRHCTCGSAEGLGVSDG
jgi:hypothetical protein